MQLSQPVTAEYSPATILYKHNCRLSTYTASLGDVEIESLNLQNRAS